MDREAEQVYAFGDYRLDVARRLLTRSNGEPVELKPRVFDVLRYLVEHAGELVEKKALLAAVWPGVVVEEHNLNKSVSTLRRVLGDDPDAQEYIATIPGRGYQFVHAVTTRVARTGYVDVPTPVHRPRSAAIAGRRLAATTVAALALAAAAFFVMQGPSGASRDTRAPTRALLDVRPADRFYGSQASQRPARTAIRLSPDGRTIVFTAFRNGVPQLFKRRLEEPQAIPLPGTENASSPFFSPDGEWVGFWQADHFKHVPLAGGPPMDIGAVKGAANIGPTGASWATDGRILFSMPAIDGIWSISASGGSAVPVTHVDVESLKHRLPHVLPNSKAMVFTATGLRGDERARLVLHRFDTAEQRVLLEDAADARYLTSGHLLFMRRGTLMAAAFDAERLEVTSTPVVLVDDVMQAIHQLNSLDETFAGQYDAAGRTLVFIPGGLHPPSRDELVWVNRNGAETPLPLGAGPFYGPRLSPNGKSVAYFTTNTGSAVADVWIYDIAGRSSRRVTFERGAWPLWSPDSTRLVFRGNGVGLRSIDVDDPGDSSTEILRTFGSEPTPSAWVGTTLIAVVGPAIWSRSMDEPGSWKSIARHDSSLQGVALSPDGHWLAYVSREAGKPDVYVQRFPGGGETTRVSMTDPESRAAGASSPLWTRGGRELVFMREKERDMVQVVAVAVDTTDGFHFGPPQVLFEGDYQQTVPVHSYDVAPDGSTFIMVKRKAREPFVTTMNLVLDWDTELEDRVRTQ